MGKVGVTWTPEEAEAVALIDRDLAEWIKTHDPTISCLTGYSLDIQRHKQVEDEGMGKNIPCK